ncbi:MAG: phosphoenolpyruvate carboxykinase (ATP), partial [Verrucomicrobia bacterium]|nr:phosphoenolpyruvate carboxykinase (ATP) [Verrucomicrobiota bacterium]
MSQNKADLEMHGLVGTGVIHWNLPVPTLVEMSLCRNESQLASNGALVVMTGKRTGRSPNDKFVVEEPSSRDRIWWSKVNTPLSRERFQNLRAKVANFFKGRDVFVFNGFAGADSRHRLPIRVITEWTWHSLFVHQLFRQPTPEELATHQPQFTVIAAPNCLADPATDGTNTE